MAATASARDGPHRWRARRDRARGVRDRELALLLGGAGAGKLDEQPRSHRRGARTRARRPVAITGNRTARRVRPRLAGRSRNRRRSAEQRPAHRDAAAVHRRQLYGGGIEGRRRHRRLHRHPATRPRPGVLGSASPRRTRADAGLVRPREHGTPGRFSSTGSTATSKEDSRCCRSSTATGCRRW